MLKILSTPLCFHIPLPSRKFVNCYMLHQLRLPNPEKVLSLCVRHRVFSGRKGSPVPGV